MGQREGGPSQQQGAGGRGHAHGHGQMVRDEVRGEVRGRKGHVMQGLGGHSGKWLRVSEVAGNEDRQKNVP